jgi:histidine phosphotransferase ChpT
MAQLTDTFTLVELVCARLCHDLGGLIGTIGTAMDMVLEETDPNDEIVAFAASASKALMQRIRLMRAAWGPDVETMDLVTLVGLATPALARRRTGLDTRALQPESEFVPPLARVLLNVILLACDSLPSGGTIVLLGEPGDLLIRLEGPGATWPADLAGCLREEAVAIAALTSARTVQMPLTALLALGRGVRLTPVLGASSGIEALRMTGGHVDKNGDATGKSASGAHSQGRS